MRIKKNITNRNRKYEKEWWQIHWWKRTLETASIKKW